MTDWVNIFDDILRYLFGKYINYAQGPQSAIHNPVDNGAKCFVCKEIKNYQTQRSYLYEIQRNYKLKWKLVRKVGDYTKGVCFGIILCLPIIIWWSRVQCVQRFIEFPYVKRLLFISYFLLNNIID